MPFKRTTKPIKYQEGKKYTLRELNEKIIERHKMFVHEYISNGWQAGKAYRKVYPNAHSSADVNACVLLKAPHIKQYIEFIKQDYEKICGVSKASQIAEYKKLAFSSLRYLHKSWIKLEEWEDIKRQYPDQLDAIESIETKVQTELDIDRTPINVEYIKIKMHSKIAALKAIDELMGYNQPTKLEIETTINDESLNHYTEEEKKNLLKLARKFRYEKE